MWLERRRRMPASERGYALPTVGDSPVRLQATDGASSNH